jgi:DNA polymerase
MGVEVDTAFVSAVSSSVSESISSPDPVSIVQTSVSNTPKTAKAPVRLKKGMTEDKWIAEALALATAANTLEELKAAIDGFEGCPLKEGAQNTVVWDGVIGAPLMVIGEGPGPQEDRTGLPFVGKAGQLLDKMLAAINCTRAENTFITNVNYWRPPGNRNPEAAELAVCRPFVDRMVELAKPKLIVSAGGVPSKALLASKSGIMKLRGTEQVFTTPSGFSAPLIPMLHPAYLLRRPQDKSRAWRDLMLVEQRLKDLG